MPASIHRCGNTLFMYFQSRNLDDLNLGRFFPKQLVCRVLQVVKRVSRIHHRGVRPGRTSFARNAGLRVNVHGSKTCCGCSGEHFWLRKKVEKILVENRVSIRIFSTFSLARMQVSDSGIGFRPHLFIDRSASIYR